MTGGATADLFRWMSQARSVDASFNARRWLPERHRPSFFAQMVGPADAVSPPEASPEP